MSDIKRYNLFGKYDLAGEYDHYMAESDDGDYVLFDKHEAEIAALKENVELLNEIAEAMRGRDCCQAVEMVMDRAYKAEATLEEIRVWYGTEYVKKLSPMTEEKIGYWKAKSDVRAIINSAEQEKAGE